MGIEEQVLEILKDESRQEGRREGRQEGKEEFLSELVSKLTSKGISVSEVSSLLEVELSLIENLQAGD